LPLSGSWREKGGIFIPNDPFDNLSSFGRSGQAKDDPTFAQTAKRPSQSPSC